MLEKIRVDKWLWSVRIYKTRTLASSSIKSGKVKVNQKTIKPSYQLKRGDKVVVGKSGFNFQFEVVDLIQKRVGAPLAQKCYIDHTPPDELNKYKDWYVGKFGAEKRERGVGRPTKRERRDIDDFKINQYLEWKE